MADVNGRKRKRADEGKTKPKKKAAIDPEVPSTPIHVSSVKRAEYCPPVIASATGFRVDNTIPFRPYQKKEKSGAKRSRRPHPSEQELLLHSTKHRTVDFTARDEDVLENGDHTLRHYVGVFDPKTGSLQIVEAQKMVMRGSVRAKQADPDALIAPADSKTRADQRVDLGQTFGTKKARKAIESNAMNALTPSKAANDEQGGEESAEKLDAASQATLSQIGKITSTMASREQLQAAVDESKPVPRANLEAEEIADVYDPNVFIGAEVLKAVPVRDWQESLESNEDIKLTSRYVARRIQRTFKQERPLEKLRLLRYLYFLITFYLTARPGRQRGTKRVPQKDQLAKNLSPAPQSVIENIRRKFSDAGEMRKFHIDLLFTHCCAVAAILDNFQVETRDLREDLQLDQKTMGQYFQEIGAKLAQVKRSGEPKAQVAKLALPLQFPQMSRGAPKRR